MKSSTWFLILAVGLIGYVLWSGGERRYAAPAAARALNYDVVAVSQGLTGQAAALDLADDLDVALLPEIGKEAFREAAGQGLREQAFLEAVLRSVSERVREISTIDLNGDDTADPVLVRPEPVEGERYVLLTLQVPTPEAYPLPAATDTAAWKKVETLEVATMTVSLDSEALTVQAQGNQYAYPGAAGQHYVGYDRSGSFLQTYFAIRMLDWMFFPRYWGFWGPGYGYGYYRPLPVSGVRGGRGAAVGTRGYQRSAASRSAAVRNRAGTAPTSRYQRAYASQPPRSLSQLQASRRFATRQSGATVRSGGFGRRDSVGRAAATPSPRYGATRQTARGFGGYGATRGATPRVGRGFGSRGFGRRGFGGFGRGMRFRR